MASPKSSQIDLGPSVGPVDVLNDLWQGFHSEAKKIYFEKMLLERKHVSDSEWSLKEIDFRHPY